MLSRTCLVRNAFIVLLTKEDGAAPYQPKLSIHSHAHSLLVDSCISVVQARTYIAVLHVEKRRRCRGQMNAKPLPPDDVKRAKRPTTNSERRQRRAIPKVVSLFCT